MVRQAQIPASGVLVATCTVTLEEVEAVIKARAAGSDRC